MALNKDPTHETPLHKMC